MAFENKEAAEALLLTALMKHLNNLSENEIVIEKTMTTISNTYLKARLEKIDFFIGSWFIQI